MIDIYKNRLLKREEKSDYKKAFLIKELIN